jgi:hypothetical protein
MRQQELLVDKLISGLACGNAAFRRAPCSGDDLRTAENVIEEYWAATPVRARKSGLLYIQQILHEELGAADPNSREFAAFVDAYIEKLTT